MSESNKNLTKYSQLFSRLELVKEKLFLTWDGLAEKMECDRSLFFQVKRGNCGFSPANLGRIHQLEIEAGIVPTHDPAPKLDRLTEAPRKKKEIARLNKIADTLAEQLGELRRAIHDLEK